MASFLDIVPALGRGLDFAQGQPGGYDAIDLRRAMSVGRQEGAVTAGAYKVTQRAAGANMSVDVASEQGAFLVQGDDAAGQGLYHVAATAQKANLDVAAAHPTNPRVDQVVLEARDAAHTGDGVTRARVYVLPGTPTNGATLDNAAGDASRAALPPSTSRLSEFVVAPGAVSVLAASLRDRRSQATGSYRRLVRKANAAGGNDYPVVGAMSPIDAANLGPRIECSGAPIRATLRGLISVAGAAGSISLRVDGQDIDSGIRYDIPANGFNNGVAFSWDFTPVAGSRLIVPYANNQGAGTTTIFARNGIPLQFVVQELVRPETAG